MPIDLLAGGIIACIVCSLCGVACAANSKKNPRRAPAGMPFMSQEQVLAEQQQMQMQMEGMINPMDMMLQEQLLQEKEETERLRNYIRRQKRAAADAILRQQAGLTSTPTPLLTAPAAPAPAMQPGPVMQGMPPRMVITGPNPGCCGGAGMISPFPQMPNPNMPPPAIPIYYLR